MASTIVTYGISIQEQLLQSRVYLDALTFICMCVKGIQGARDVSIANNEQGYLDALTFMCMCVKGIQGARDVSITNNEQGYLNALTFMCMCVKGI